MEDCFIYCLSNSENDIGENNTLTKFTHRLAKRLHFPKKENWGLCLWSFSFQNQTDCPAHLIKIVCDQVYEDINTKKIISLHSRKPFSLGEDKNHFHSPKQKDYFPLMTDSLDRISFEILDENNQRFPLTSGPSTWIVIHLKKMIGAFLPLRVSSAVTAEFPNNTPSDFNFNLPSDLGYKGVSPFEICLSSITLTPTFNQLPFFSKDPEAEKLIVEIHDERNEKKIFFSTRFNSEKNYLCEEELVFEVMKYFRDIKKQDPMFTDIGITTYYDTESGHVSLVAKNLRSHHKLQVYLPTPLALQLGFRKASITGHHSMIPLKPDHNTTSDYPADVNYHIPQSAVVYTSFTKPALFGVGMSNVLKIIPLKIIDTSSKFVTIESTDLEWYGMSYSSVSDLNFKLIGMDGKKLQFNKNSIVHICLKLRLKK